ncbi:deoxyribodipyrimidine photo-lyase-like [Alligator sinensis]|uniref:Deoxyribodipyrimidine photo-lyase n=1 Tax=Alligator sinensis TaxID=38654 RepID=A0A3Q0GJZ8_ALLSI|nr:deoxyribodipyrimidine photo-lyase-like [Alligator sinensis]
MFPKKQRQAAGADTEPSGSRKRGRQDAEVAPGVESLSEAVKQARRRAALSVREFKFNKKRVRLLSQESHLQDGALGILYWMSRDQRVQDNWAFLYAQRLALKQQLPLHVCFCLVPKFLDATIRHFGFLLKGLQEVAEECGELGIPFHLLQGYAKDVLPAFVTRHGIGGVVTDFSPLRVPLQWVEDVKERLPQGVPLVQVDAHNIVPCWVASNKQEYGARTIRPKIHAQLPEFLTEFPPIIQHPFPAAAPAQPIDWDACYAGLEVDRTVPEVKWATPGTAAGLAVLQAFVARRLPGYSEYRNNPNKAALSNLSPWFHFGQVSVQRAVLEVQKSRDRHRESVNSFVEEAVIRRELADNFCFYNKSYDQLEGAHDWARDTLILHARDKREYLYDLQQLEEGKTHDQLWNAAQIQMVREGKMHGFLRMYWAKKILEWTRSPEDALRFAIYLNDRFELDGRDPNGYGFPIPEIKLAPLYFGPGPYWPARQAQAAHSRTDLPSPTQLPHSTIPLAPAAREGAGTRGGAGQPDGDPSLCWAERNVFGKIRYMNYAGCKRKFNVGQFEHKYRP